MNLKLKLIIFYILIILTNSVIGQNSPSKNISDFIKIINNKPNKKQVEHLKKSLNSKDTFEYSLAISLLFKYFPEEYKTPMIDAFSIPYLNTKRDTTSKIYTAEEVLQINKEISSLFDMKYHLEKEDRDAVYMLYTFIEYRKRNVWTYYSDKFSIPTTIAIRGGYLRGLLGETMDYKKFISEISESEKHNYEMKTKN